MCLTRRTHLLNNLILKKKNQYFYNNLEKYV